MQVNNEDVRKKPHTELVKLIGSLESEVCLKVVHVPKFKILSFEAKKFRTEKKKAEEQQISEDKSPSGDKVRFWILIFVRYYFHYHWKYSDILLYSWPPCTDAETNVLEDDNSWYHFYPIQGTLYSQRGYKFNIQLYNYISIADGLTTLDYLKMKDIFAQGALKLGR